VFAGKEPGFDAIVGNPPFAGKNTLIASHRERYPDWLRTIHEGAHGNADLVAHFFRRAFALLRRGGAFGLIATNTIRQGDTRATGLRPIREAGGTIFRAVRRLKWPGEAAVVVSVVHVCKGPYPSSTELDGQEVERITAFLFSKGGDADPVRLAANAGKSFQGSIVLGMGFTFDDTDRKGAASSLAEMRRLVERNPRNRDRIFPYIGGEEINDSPIHAHHRYIINFEDLSESKARSFFRQEDTLALRYYAAEPMRSGLGFSGQHSRIDLATTLPTASRPSPSRPASRPTRRWRRRARRTTASGPTSWSGTTRA
jgi:hypothetical protein